MKKFLIVIAIVLFGFPTVNAQEINFGAKAGVNFASINGDEAEIFSSRTSLHLGIFSEIMLSDNFSIQPELLYSAQGADYKDFDYIGTTKFDYLNIPIMAKIYVAEGFSLEAGPQVGFLLSAKDDWEDIETGVTGEDDIKDSTKGIDFGVNVGIGYKLKNGLNFGARYNLGLSKINDFDNVNALRNDDEKVPQKFTGYDNMKWFHGIFLLYLSFTLMSL